MPGGDMKRPDVSLRDDSGKLNPEQGVYVDVMETLTAARIPFLVGGGVALASYTGMARAIKDLDLFVLSENVSRIMEVCSDAGYQTKVRFAHWLGKVSKGDVFVDIISARETDSALSTRRGFSMPFREKFLIGPSSSVHRKKRFGPKRLSWNEIVSTAPTSRTS